MKQIIFGVMMCCAILGIQMGDAQAFCGFYVNGAGDKLFNDATQVVMMREGTRTVLSMRNTYQGPLKDFAMVVPVPEVLKKEQVKTISDHIFQKVDTLAAPRLVKYWEQNPCPRNYYGRGGGGLGFGRGIGSLMVGSGTKSTASTGRVRVRARFKKGEYDIVILSANDSNALESWLKSNKYNIPKGASQAMKPYIQKGMYFFVAKVDIKKAKTQTIAGKKRTILSPLRFDYNSKDFSLPVRLGLLNANGKQDLLVHILAKRQRYEVANAPNVTIPTNLIVDGSIQYSFGNFYAALFDYTVKQTPGAVVTEYAWESTKCDPCPAGNFRGQNVGGPLNYRDLMTLGLDALSTDPLIYNFNLNERTQVIRGKSPLGMRNVRRHIMSHAYMCAMAQEGPRNNRQYTANALLSISLDPKDEQIRIASRPNNNNELQRQFHQCLLESLSSVDKKTFKSFGVQSPTAVQTSIYFSDRQYRQRQWARSQGWVLTRLHARYSSKDLKDDLIFKAAKPIIGGRGMPYGWPAKVREEGAQISTFNNFQGRYIMLQKWKGKIACKKPRRGMWGGPSSRYQPNPSFALRNGAFASRKAVKLSRVIRSKNQPGLPWFKKRKKK